MTMDEPANHRLWDSGNGLLRIVEETHNSKDYMENRIALIETLARNALRGRP